MEFISTQNYFIYGILRLFGISYEEFDILVKKLEVSLGTVAR
ncbi:hypothetical protein Sarmat_00854 [Rickettsiales endosymbiont of Paramecium tredecaurelia]|nr:hypothetical protein [Candidatus Sarmatiella mevalonica]MBL3284991.1 hypothetical protein [Candidatus Sarmatiella mevalonica]